MKRKNTNFPHIDVSWSVLNFIFGKDDISVDLYECDEYQLNVLDYLEDETGCDENELKHLCEQKCNNLYKIWTIDTYTN